MTQKASLSRKIALTGTYVAEQSYNNSYDLLAAPLAHQTLPPWGVPLPISARGPEHRRRKLSGRGVSVKCTHLRALECLEPILSKEPAASSFSTAQGGGRASSLSPEFDESQMLQTARASTATSHGTSRTFTSRLSSSEPTDEEFKDWLTSLRIGWVQGSSMNDSMMSNGSDGSAWHILLMGRTFDDGDNTRQHVIKCLIDILGLSSALATRKATVARERTTERTTLQRCTNRKDASKKMQALRKKGLVVQVASEGDPGDNSPRRAAHSKVASTEAQVGSEDGLPGENVEADEVRAPAGKAPENRMKARRVTYFDIFQQATPECTRRRLVPPVVSPPGPRLPSKDGLRRNSAEVSSRRQSKEALCQRNSFRRQSIEACQDLGRLQVIPADAVEAFFKDERDEAPGDKRRSHTGEAQENLPPPNAVSAQTVAAEEPASTSRFRQILQKHGMISAKLPALSNNFMQKDGSTSWEEVRDALRLDALESPIAPAKKEACQLLRFLVFGEIGNEHAKTPQELEAVFYEHIGTQEQVCTLYNLWQRIDADNSGRVDMTEFRAFAAEHLESKFKAGLSDIISTPNVPVMWHTLRASWCEDRDTVLARLCEKVEVQLLGKKSSFIIEDMMRCIWPHAQQTDLKTMKTWCQEHVGEAARSRVLSPPALTKQDFEDLCIVFRHYDDGESGEILFDALVEKGLIYADQIETCKKDWDRNGNGLLDMLEFCQMMCPVGYRASQESTIGTQKDGKRVVFDKQIDGWRLDGHTGAGSCRPSTCPGFA